MACESSTCEHFPKLGMPALGGGPVAIPHMAVCGCIREATRLYAQGQISRAAVVVRL